MNSSHIGIFALALLPILLTVPSAFADHDPAHDTALEYSLMLSISDAQSDLTNLQAMAENNGFTVEYGDYNIATFDEAAGLVDDFQYEAAQELLDDAELSHDYIYEQFYEQIEEQQDVRFDEYVERAKSSLNFIINNGKNLGLSSTVIDQLATTLAILEKGTDDQIKAATGGNSQIGITLSVLPDLDLPKSFTTGSGAEEQLKAKLPPGIAKQYGYSTDSGVGTVSYEGDENNSNDLPPGYDMKIRDDEGNLLSFEDTNLPSGFKTKFDGVAGFLDPEVEVNLDDLPGGFAKKLTNDDLLPKGFVKKYNAIAELYGFESYGDVWEPDYESGIYDDYDDYDKAKKGKKDCKGKECGKSGEAHGKGKGKPDKPDKPDKPGKPDKPDKPGKP